MNTAHWHLLLNHLPVTGIIIGTLVLATGQLLKNSTVMKTALGILLFTGLTAVPAFLTGEGAEEVVEKLPGVTEATIEDHEEMGKIFLISTIATGLLAVITFFVVRNRTNPSRVLYGLVFAACLVTCVLAKQVGTSGGLVRHPEIVQGASAQQQSEPSGNGQEDDD